MIAALNGAWVLPTMIGTSTASLDAGQTTKLLVFNMWWNNKQLAAVKALIARTDPDIIVLLEVSQRSRPDLRTLDAAYPYRVECWTSLPCDALVLSRKSLTEQTTATELDGVRLGVARAGFDLNGCPVTLFAAHLNRPWPYHSHALNTSQGSQFAALATAVRQWPGLKIVVGDLNAAPWTHGIRQLADAVNGKPLGGLSGTWPWFLPAILKLPIDHVIVSRPSIMASRTVLASTGSDHSPVLATLSVPDPALCRP
jgi:endonuclease/exonuclease/phosphatase (EEP) superfamily protein YafD